MYIMYFLYIFALKDWHLQILIHLFASVFYWILMLTVEIKLNHKDLEKIEEILKEDKCPLTLGEIKLLMKRLINHRYLKCWLCICNCICGFIWILNFDLHCMSFSSLISLWFKIFLPIFNCKIPFSSQRVATGFYWSFTKCAHAVITIDPLQQLTYFVELDWQTIKPDV